MLAATLLGVFFIPALFVIVERIKTRREKKHPPAEIKPPDEGAAPSAPSH
jgi:hypothetical protein